MPGEGASGARIASGARGRLVGGAGFAGVAFSVCLSMREGSFMAWLPRQLDVL